MVPGATGDFSGAPAAGPLGVTATRGTRRGGRRRASAVSAAACASAFTWRSRRAASSASFTLLADVVGDEDAAERRRRLRASRPTAPRRATARPAAAPAPPPRGAGGAGGIGWSAERRRVQVDFLLDLVELRREAVSHAACSSMLLLRHQARAGGPTRSARRAAACAAGCPRRARPAARSRARPAAAPTAPPTPCAPPPPPPGGLRLGRRRAARAAAAQARGSAAACSAPWSAASRLSMHLVKLGASGLDALEGAGVGFFWLAWISCFSTKTAAFSVLACGRACPSAPRPAQPAAQTARARPRALRLFANSQASTLIAACWAWQSRQSGARGAAGTGRRAVHLRPPPPRAAAATGARRRPRCASALLRERYRWSERVELRAGHATPRVPFFGRGAWRRIWTRWGAGERVALELLAMGALRVRVTYSSFASALFCKF